MMFQPIPSAAPLLQLVSANPPPNDVRWVANETHVQFSGEHRVRTIATEVRVQFQEVVHG